MFGAIFNVGGAPIDPARLGDGRAAGIKTARSTKLLEGRVALLCSSVGAPAREDQSAMHSLDGRSWLVGQVRLDARDELVRRLAEQGKRPAPSDSNALLCLHAYTSWGERFVEYLYGDYAFILWDADRKCLIAVVDRLGTHALFHARTGDSWFVGDRLEWVARQARPARDLDDYWIADFLSIGQSREFERTVYSGVHRLAPAHLVSVNETKTDIRRYWRLDLVEPLQLASDAAYVERFLDLLHGAIADRLPPKPQRLGISMSGGLDSSLLACCIAGTVKDPTRIFADCEHYEQLMHIGEGQFASLVARRLGIELRVRVVDDDVYDPQWRTRGVRSAEPTPTVMNGLYARRRNDAWAAQAPVWFNGEGPDSALWPERNAYLSWLLRQGRWRELATAVVRYVAVKGIGGWAQTFKRHFAGPQPGLAYYGSDHLPKWLRHDLVDRLRLVERARELSNGAEPPHPWHPAALAALTSPIFQNFFSDYVEEEPLSPIAWRYPYLDLRVLEFMFSLPPIPWGWKKHLMRRAGRGRLPNEVLRREKTPLPIDPDLAVLRRHGLPALLGPTELERYVDVTDLPAVQAPDRDLRCVSNLLALDYWLAGGRL